MPRSFHVGDLLTCTTGSMLSPTGDDGVQALLRYVTGLPTLGSAGVEARQFVGQVLIEQHHWLLVVKPRSTEPEALKQFLHYVIAHYGAYHDVEPIDDGSVLPYTLFRAIVESLFSKLDEPGGRPDGP